MINLPGRQKVAYLLQQVLVIMLQLALAWVLKVEI
jgi:hypothetical protein